MNNIRAYLCREAERITNASPGAFASLDAWERERPARLREYLEMMSLPDGLSPKEDRPPLNITVTGVLQRKGYRVEKLCFESLPRLYVRGNLYVPDGLKDPAPGVLYVCGHSPAQKAHYQAHPRRFAQLGFVALVVDTIEYGEVRGYHHGCYTHGWWHWYSRGYTPGGAEIWNAVRALDLLQARPDVDPARLGVTGISGGGAVSWYLGAADERARVVSPVCGTGTLAAHVVQRSVDGHCDCMFHINTYRRDLSDIGALIAPRPLLVASADRDSIYSIESIRDCCDRIRRVYDLYGAADRIQLIETPGPHSYHVTSRTAIFSYFLKHLCGRDVPPEEVGDLDESPEAQEAEKDLIVHPGGPLSNDRTTTIQDDFVRLASPPDIRTEQDLKACRERVIADLRRVTFGAFPETPPGPDLRLEMRWAGGCRYTFIPEDGWRLPLLWRSGSSDGPSPAVLFLRSPAEKRWAGEGFLNGLPSGWGRAYLETRGIGETSWGPDLQWHIRRASAVTGRTIASMRVYDALRGLDVLRGLEGVDPRRIVLAAQGEMAAIALYAALLDGGVQALLLGEPPGTQDAPSEPDGTGPAIEMLNCLRVADLPAVAALLYPAQIVFVGRPSPAYRWTEDVYARLGPPGEIHHANRSLGEWRPKW